MSTQTQRPDDSGPPTLGLDRLKELSDGVVAIVLTLQISHQQVDKHWLEIVDDSRDEPP